MTNIDKRAITIALEQLAIDPKFGCALLGFSYLPPYPPQWPYPHLLATSGGIIPYDEDCIREQLQGLLTP